MNLLPVRVLLFAFFISAFLLLGSQMQAQDLLEQGDDLSEYIKTSEMLYLKGKRRISAWLEGEIYLYSTTAESEVGQPLVITSQKKFPFAIVQGQPPNSHYLIDTTGDRILNVTRKKLFIPFWVVFENSTKMGPQKGVLTIMNLMYSALRANEHPATNPKMKQALSIIKEYAGDAEKANRDLVYLLYFYSRHNQNELELSFYAVEEMRKRIRNRYNQVHPLNLLYTAECLIRFGRSGDAGKFLKDLLTIDPDFVPAKVYQHQIERDAEKAGLQLKELKENYGDHWAVKDLR